MMKLIKVCLIAGSICVLVGGGISLTAAAFGGNVWKVLPDHYHAYKEKFTNFIMVDWVNVFDDDDQNMEERQEVFSSAQIQKMDLDIRSGKVAFADDSSTDEITISSNKDKSNYSCLVVHDELTIQVNPNQPEDDTKLSLMIHVPKDFHFSSVTLTAALEKSAHHLKSRSSSIKVQSLSADELKIVTKTGAVLIEDGSVGKLDIESDVGAVEYRGTVLSDIVTGCKVGSVNLKLNGKKEDYNYHINCKIGSIELGDEDFTALKGKKTIDNGAHKTMDLECKTGAIEVDFAEDAF